MRNYEAAQKLIGDADKYLEEAIRNYKEKEFNIVIRRAQEAVELYLKGFLKLLCVEFPKIHDIGAFFVDILDKKGIEITREERNIIIEASSFLAERRAPAFYREIEYEQEDAFKSLNFAESIKKIIKKLFKKNA